VKKASVLFTADDFENGGKESNSSSRFLLHHEQRSPLGYLPERITSSLLASLRAVVFKDGETVSSSPSRSADASFGFCLGEKIMVFAPLLQLTTVFVCFRYKILVEKLYKVSDHAVTHACKACVLSISAGCAVTRWFK